MRYRVLVVVDEVQWYSYRTLNVIHLVYRLDSLRKAGLIQSHVIYEERELINREGQTEVHLEVLEKSPGFDDRYEYPF